MRELTYLDYMTVNNVFSRQKSRRAQRIIKYFTPFKLQGGKLWNEHTLYSEGYGMIIFCDVICEEI